MRALPGCLVLLAAVALYAQEPMHDPKAMPPEQMQQPAAPQSPPAPSTPAAPAGPSAPVTPSAGATQTAEQKMEAELAHDRKVLQDWANLARYRNDNATLAPAAPGQDRVIFMGDSITDAWGRTRGVFFPGKPYVNRGISGQTTPQMLIRFRPDVIALKPKVVVILAGTNDIAGNTGPETLEEIEGNLQSMAELAKASGIHVVLSSVTPVCDYIRPQTERRPPQEILALNSWTKDYCERNGCVYLDYYPAMLDDKGMLKKELTIDGLHPNGEGYAVMTPLAEQAITTALSK